jgi:hypothetical protein
MSGFSILERPGKGKRYKRDIAGPAFHEYFKELQHGGMVSCTGLCLYSSCPIENIHESLPILSRNFSGKARRGDFYRILILNPFQ